MPTPTVYELVGAALTYDPRNPDASLPYLVVGSDVEAEVRAAVLAKVPAVFGGMPLRRLRPVEDKKRQGVWYVDAEFAPLDAQPGLNPLYAPPPPPPGVPAPPPPPAPPPAPTEDQALGSQYSFQWAMTQTRFLISKQTTQRVKAGGGVPDEYFAGAIGVGADGVPAGVDLPAWPEAITLSSAIPAMTFKFLRRLRQIVGTTNALPFMGHPKDELLYLGGNAVPREGGGFTITHRFAQDDNRTGVRITDDLTVNVPPFHYVWCRYRRQTTGVVTAEVPYAAYVERLYDADYFNDLGLWAVS